MSTSPPSPAFWHRVAGFLHAAGHLVSDAFVKLFGKDAAEKFAAASLALLKSSVGQIAL
jgi:hypothetical protein